jgi:hypothetical protein
MPTFHLFCLNLEYTRYPSKLFEVRHFSSRLEFDCFFLIASCHFLSTGGINTIGMSLDSCISVPFDTLIDTVISNFSLSEVFNNMASDVNTDQLGCVVISSVLIPPENSLHSIEFATENAAIHASINDESLKR